jgi:hypothetical protein
MTPPVACALSREDLRIRRGELLPGLATRAERIEYVDGGVRLHMPASTDGVASIARVVDAERHCCRFLSFTITAEPDLGAVTVTVTAPPDAQQLLSELVASSHDVD